MEYTTLGRTGLTVSVAGLGCGGASRLGRATGRSFDESVGVVSEAIELGVNFIDTALVYQTEDIVGTAIKGKRDKLVISSKALVIPEGADYGTLELCSAAVLRQRVEGSLKRLGTDYIDVYHMHGVKAKQLPHLLSEFGDTLQALRSEGKIRFFGVTEHFSTDTTHSALAVALTQDFWDVVMVGFNFLNPSARHRVLDKTRAKNIGVVGMFAVRRALNDPRTCLNALRHAVEAGQLDGALLKDDLLEFLTARGGASSMQEAAYRFSRHEPGIDVVLTGTGSREHLRQNVASINLGPLPAAHLLRLDELLGSVDAISGE